ncbi:hypothetical protein LMG29660_02715 [Burkholderia puraquae]|uniref:Uncharacterized protein n=2 Tax=Burkholderia puraquae TaxID=1904757 RepID=A0A6J5DQY3_9BURK|nr:hypothetical protein [Burkholderia puraquae]CAB3755914.1 hypothetical protein LMG29660_02715 [Burkholderia puraquae]
MYTSRNAGLYRPLLRPSRRYLGVGILALIELGLAGCGDGTNGESSAASFAASVKTAASVPQNFLYATSNEPAATAADQTNLADGFNASVNEATKLVFSDANYSWLSNWGSWSTNPACGQAAMDTALANGGNNGYLAGLSNRCAYYSRDFAHYLVGAHYMGYHSQNLDMARHFAQNLYLNSGLNMPYWAFGTNGGVYERKDEQPAVFEIGQSLMTLYKLTGDQSFIATPLKNYIDYINNQYWTKTYSNTNLLYQNADGFRLSRNETGETATYNEFAYDPTEGQFIPPGYDIFLGADSAATQVAYYCQLAQYPDFLLDPSTASTYSNRCASLKSNFNLRWLNAGANHFYAALAGVKGTVFTTNNASKLTYIDGYVEEPNIYPLYKNVMAGEQSAVNQANYVDANAEAKYTKNNNYTPGIESFTYLPTSLFNVSDGSANRYDNAWKWLRRLANTVSADAKREPDGYARVYPEVPFVMIADTITKVIGLDFDGLHNSFTTLPRLPSNFDNSHYMTVHHVPLSSKSASGSYTLPVDITVKKVANLYPTDITAYGIQLNFTSTKPWQVTGYSGALTWTPRFSGANEAKSCAINVTYDDGTTDTKTYSTVQSNLPIYTCATSTGAPVTVSIPVGTSASKHVSKVVAVTYTSSTPPPELLNGMPD